MRRSLVAWLIVAAWCLAADPARAAGGAVLQGLDKVTARIFTFEAPVDRMVKFGRLEIVARVCVIRFSH